MNLVESPWNVGFLVGFVVYGGIRHVFEQRTKDNEKVVDRGDGVEIALLVVVFAGSLVLPVLYLFSSVLSFADHALPQPGPGIGCAVMVASLWLLWRAHADIGLNWSPTLALRRGPRAR